MDVLVTGGTGFIGTALCQELADRGHNVTALGRGSDGGDVPSGVTFTAGDVTEYDTIEDAFAGTDIVVNLVALSPLFKPSGGDKMHEIIHFGGTKNVVDAATAHDLDGIVQLSALGADPAGPTAYLRSKGEAERVVTESDIPWTIFRPSVVFGDGGEFVAFTKQLTTPYVTALPGGGSTRFQPIHRDDLVEMIATAVEDADHRGEVYEIGGPDALTLAEVTRLVYEAAGHSVSVLPLPMSLAKIGLSVADALPFVPFGADQFRSLRLDNVTEDNDIDQFGLSTDDLMTFREYLNRTDSI